ncbi:hypothetical protein [Rufibacter sp. LB8]|uniref:hypothetical protein n=1 Tax=Rufibacter sp. LB8 TaxID=2777781 RepID=UPI00178C6D2A|nr:hypothetical protein [Rufibacter sp. LB8]
MYQQDYSQYTIRQQQTWNILFTKREQALRAHVAAPFWAGMQVLELKAYFIPDFQELNFLLQQKTGWQLMAVPAQLTPAQTLAKWAKRRFPAVTQLRANPTVDLRLQGGAPDLFTDVFCFLPWLLTPAMADFLQRLGTLAQEHPSVTVTEKLWHVAHQVLFKGLLVDQTAAVTLLGAHLLSNAPEAEAALQSARAWRVADAKDLLETPANATLGELYFVLENLATLATLITQLETGFLLEEEVAAPAWQLVAS